ncbi:hypothetical protein IV827_004562, partial [Salmonella enterica]|nr:hypothetical protein [Salmonella enterica]
DLGVVAGAADSGVVAGAADSGVVAGAGEFTDHLVGRSSFSLNELSLIQMRAVHLIDQPARIVETLIGDQRAMYIGVCATLWEFIQKPAEAISTGVPGFNLFFGDLH